MSDLKTELFSQIDELQLRYWQFCEKNDLDDTLPPDEQYEISVSQQRWIDRHLDTIKDLEMQLLSNGKIVKQNASKDDNDIIDNDELHSDYHADMSQMSIESGLPNFYQ